MRCFETTQVVVLLVASVWWVVPLPALAAEQPVRLGVEISHLEVEVGETVPLDVVLRDSRGNPVAAPRAFVVELAIDLPGGERVSRRVEIPAGERSVSTEFEAREPGVAEISASHPELRGGGAFVQIKKKEQQVALMAFREAVAAPQGAPPPPSPPSGPAPGAPELKLASSTRHPPLANGADPATIYAFLQGENRTGYTIRLVPDSGQLIPLPLEIPPGRTSGKAELTAEQPGVVKVNYLGATPSVAGELPEFLEVAFVPAITALEVTSSPREVVVGGSADVTARLVGADGRPLATLTERQVTFALGEGRARLGERTVTIPPGGFEARTTLEADWWGEAVVEAASPHLLRQTAPVTILFPWAFLTISAIGSLAGGFIAWTYGRSRHKWLWQRLFTGLVAGLVLYWLLLFSDLLPSAALANPLGVFAVSVLGGWAGTEIFDAVLERFKLRTA